MTYTPSPKYYIPVAFVGPVKAGKTSLVNAVTENQFVQDSEVYKPSHMIDFKLSPKTKDPYQFKLFDCSGRPDDQKNMATICKKTRVEALCLCVDLTKTENELRSDIDTYLAYYNPYFPNHHIILVGCQSDRLLEAELNKKNEILEQITKEKKFSNYVCMQVHQNKKADSKNAINVLLASMSAGSKSMMQWSETSLKQSNRSSLFRQYDWRKLRNIQYSASSSDVRLFQISEVTYQQKTVVNFSKQYFDVNLREFKMILLNNTYHFLLGGHTITLNNLIDNKDNREHRVPTHILAMLGAKSMEEVQRTAWVANHAYSPGRMPKTAQIYHDIQHAIQVPGLSRPLHRPEFYMKHYADKDNQLQQWQKEILTSMRMKIGGTRVQLIGDDQEVRRIRIPAHMVGIVMAKTIGEAKRFAELALKAHAPGRTKEHRAFYQTIIDYQKPEKGLSPRL